MSRSVQAVDKSKPLRIRMILRTECLEARLSLSDRPFLKGLQVIHFVHKREYRVSHKDRESALSADVKEQTGQAVDSLPRTSPLRGPLSLPSTTSPSVRLSG